MIKIEHMKQFLAVCEFNSLSEAAKSLHRSPSAISMTLKHIEEFLGKPLFEGERKQKLTPLGKHMKKCATRAVAEHQRALDEIVSFSKGESGCVKVSAVPSVATHLLPLVIAELYKKHADIRVDLRDIDSLAVAKTVSEGASDFGIASLSPRSKNLKTELLTEEPLMCICPQDHPLAKIDRPLSWDDMAQYPFIANVLVDQINHPQVQMLVAAAQLRMRNLASLIAFIEAGFGITLLPRMAASLAPGLCAKTIEENTIKRQLYLLQARDRSLSATAQVFKEEVLLQVKNLNN